MGRSEILWAAFGAASAFGCMALGVALGDAMRDPSATPATQAPQTMSEAVDVRIVEPPALPPAPAPYVYDPVRTEPPLAPTPFDPAAWDLNAAFPPSSHARLDEPFPPMPPMAVASTPSRQQLDALPESLGSTQHSRLDEAFPRSRLDDIYF